jgi:hypothetical protein
VADTAVADEAVGRYLRALRDPSSARDEATIQELEQRLATLDDPVERLLARSDLLRATQADASSFEAGFTEHAKTWAEANRVSAEAFTAEGVPADVLRRAGFRVGGRVGGRGGTGRQRSDRRRTRVGVEKIREALPKGKFTLRQVQEATGASPATVRKVVMEQVAAGKVKELGPDEKHAGPGRAPTLYKR